MKKSVYLSESKDRDIIDYLSQFSHDSFTYLVKMAIREKMNRHLLNKDVKQVDRVNIRKVERSSSSVDLGSMLDKL